MDRVTGIQMVRLPPHSSLADLSNTHHLRQTSRADEVRGPRFAANRLQRTTIDNNWSLSTSVHLLRSDGKRYHEKICFLRTIPGDTIYTCNTRQMQLRNKKSMKQRIAENGIKASILLSFTKRPIRNKAFIVPQHADN